METIKKLDELKIDRSRARDPFPWGRVFLVILIIAVLGFGAYAWASRKATPEVKTFTVSEPANGAGGSQTVLNASGYVTARRQATVSSKVTGQVTEVLFDEGQHVVIGQVLARIDPSNIETSLNHAKAQLAVAKSAVLETTAQLDQAKRDLKRTSDLFANKISTQSDLDKAQSDADVLHARLERQQVEITVAEREVATWQQQLDDTVIRAPFPGVIVSKSAQPGEIISPMSAGGGFTRTGIGTIVDMASLEIEVDVNENYINRVEPGQPVDAVLDAYPDWHIPCKVIAIIPTADRQKATVKVRIGFDKLDKRILPDMGVKVSFQHNANDPAAQIGGITVPKTALRKDGEQDIVLVVTDNKLERRAIKTGATRGDEVTVLSNVKSGERVVVEGPENLKDGDRVKETKL
ncbi:MAG: efflux RND transporter periplasmic adaptor subunit [Limisphaerales bacterium]